MAAFGRQALVASLLRVLSLPLPPGLGLIALELLEEQLKGIMCECQPV